MEPCWVWFCGKTGPPGARRPGRQPGEPAGPHSLQPMRWLQHPEVVPAMDRSTAHWQVQLALAG